jgi:hypothetical protein
LFQGIKNRFEKRVLSFNQMTFECLKFRFASVLYLHQLSIQSDS